ncbi:Rv3235 family protein [Nocardioides pantholopis]|uniref:Rv3235 family protein n=1 Tax=Nocardioides pantholopis TaxID=2483798 RepID=UPI000F07EBE6|nr:Rv3235 family protein [Nocardioides pantholopis]
MTAADRPLAGPPRRFRPLRETVVPIRVPVPLASTQGTLALDLEPRHDPPAAASPAGRAAGDVVPIDRRWRGDVEQWSHRFAQAAVEIVGGDRPVSQLLRWTTSAVYADLERRARLVAQAGGHGAAQGRVQPVRPKVLSVRTCFLDRGVVESGIHVRYGERSRALAARFELRAPRREEAPRWICTALDWS